MAISAIEFRSLQQPRPPRRTFAPGSNLLELSVRAQGVFDPPGNRGNPTRTERTVLTFPNHDATLIEDTANGRHSLLVPAQGGENPLRVVLDEVEMPPDDVSPTFVGSEPDKTGLVTSVTLLPSQEVILTRTPREENE